MFDTTLRDGTQMEGFSLSPLDKLAVAKRLDAFGVHYIEGGWPGSNPRDKEFFALAEKEDFKNALLMAFCSTHHKKFTPEEDPNLRATLESGAKGAVVFGKTWKFHTQELLGITPEENFSIIETSVKFLKDAGLKVFFDAEHFFNGFEDDEEFSFLCLEAAIRGGADNLTLCETNGGMLPERVYEITKKVGERFSNISIGIHAHNDGELAVANSLSAIRAGATLVQGTINGVGERCGNANLCSILPNLELKMGIQTVGKENLRTLTELSLFVSERANFQMPKNLPFVGRTAFAHKGGIHVSAVSKFPHSYEAILPESVGNERRITISDLSGKSNLMAVAKKMGFAPQELGDEFFTNLLIKIKAFENEGIQFEGASASFELLFYRSLPHFIPAFEIENFFVHTSKIEEEKEFPVEAMVSGKVGKVSFHTAGFGNGPVGALDDALRKALSQQYPQIVTMKLIDFKVRITDVDAGTSAKTRVFIESTDEKNTWGTVGCSQNIIEASLDALVDSFLYFLR